MGMRGRLWAQTLCLLAEGILVIVFANTPSLAAAITVMVFFSLFVQAAEGTSFGIVPYIDPPNTGSISGIIGAGGNTGAVLFGLAFRQLEYKQAFVIMGACIIGGSLTSFILFIKGHSGLVCGQDTIVASKPEPTLEVPMPDAEKADEIESADDVVVDADAEKK
jgi:NNP family nitrate/nitrite transporter-like MFS transporter